MAEGFLKSFDSELEVYSAGTYPAAVINPNTVAVMREIGIDLSQNKTKHVNQFLDEDFDFVITVCGGAKETCPVFLGKVRERLHIGFNDPAEAQGSPAEIIKVYRRVRDEIQSQFYEFYKSYLKSN